MPRSRSPRAGSAGVSRSSDNEDPPAASTSYRIERYDSSSTTDLMVTSRSKRSTAGNRLKALLDQELEKDEVFAEVENDVDFEANEHDDGVDIVDSDFDRDSDDDARPGVDDDSAGEREIEAQEKADKQKRRATARAVGIIKRPAPVRAPPEPKRRRISFAPEQSTSRSSPSSTRAGSADSPAGLRSSARTATVQSKLQVESRLEEATQRKAAQPVRVVQKKKQSLTQDALIAEALEVEEENRESLRRFLEQEEERRAKQRQRKERITGPFVRWVSVGLKTRVVEDVTPQKVRAEDAGASKESAEQSGTPTATQPSAVHGGDRGESSAPDSAAMAQGSTAASSQAAQDDAQATAKSDEPATAAQSAQSASTSGVDPNATSTPASAPPSSTPKPSPASNVASSSSLTLDPVLAARAETLLQRTNPSTHPPSTTPFTGESGWEKQARTLLSVERMPEDWEWLDEFNALLGTHCNWESYAFVPHRNRPLRPRQSVCPITGLPAIYKDPRTGIPYATAHAYGVITKLIHHKFRWANAPWGVYTDDEDQLGPGGVWQKAREMTLKPKPEEKGDKDKGKDKEKEKERSREKPKEKEDKRSKPGFDVVLTNAIAPGDEKALLAQALSLPAGSTRSGRRVHRN
ncbi:YL1-like protein [Moesziomyces antarcticus]|uniref:Related to VPS72 - component of the SWR1 complex, required for vacuolar protein sorting n=2 Tax=Pseudozyma antarctica TaxID=84753 RepID=A0A5C3FW66_PSEA2|nr:YL1-like protein [Moesziomyces antarcticus]GAK67406.1 YL1-like protein [Moesziomyces antarcticus]SPO48658.1 related to VPS72 - component of the SWR1 complex, required for vacuolar protein sorting [Moesziomyces antarcticus]